MKTGDLISRKYRLLQRLAEGGMGEVWGARNERTNRDFAVKFLLPSLARHPEALQRFVREAKATGQLSHPNLVPAIDAGMHEGRPYLVMELLKGESLESRLERQRSLSLVETCLMIGQVARALEHVHAAGLVHRDLSAANVFLVESQDGPSVRVLDFGVSKVLRAGAPSRLRTGDGVLLGSPAYMSPEQARGAGDVDIRGDLWALGVLAYQSVTGRFPFDAPNYNALVYAILHGTHDPITSVLPELDPEFAELVESCLIKDRELRPSHAGEVAEAFERLALRLASAQAPRGVPRRRATDRFRPRELSTAWGWLERGGLPPSAWSMKLRLAHWGQSWPRGTGFALGAAVGAAAVLALVRLSSPGVPDGIVVTPSAPPACSAAAPQAAHAAITARPAIAAVSHELELARAVSVGLSSPNASPVAPSRH